MNTAVSQYFPLSRLGLVLVFSRASRALVFLSYWEPPRQRCQRHPQLRRHFRPAQPVVPKQLSRFGQPARIMKKAPPTPSRRFGPILRRRDKASLRSHRPIAQDKHLYPFGKHIQVLRSRPQNDPSGFELFNQSHQVRQRLPEPRDRPHQERISRFQLAPTTLQLRPASFHPNTVNKYTLGSGLLKLPDLPFTIAIDGGDPHIPECPGRTSQCHAQKSTTKSAEPAQQQTQDGARLRCLLCPEGLRSVSWVLRHTRPGQTTVAAKGGAITACFSIRRRAVAGAAVRGGFPGSGFTLHNPNY